jgi:hypothetical protein
MSRFRYRSPDRKDISPEAWLQIWSARYAVKDYPGYEELIAKHRSFSAIDFERIGRWKDGVLKDDNWRPNVAMVAYKIWMQAARELPRPSLEDHEISRFLEEWSERKYTDEYEINAKRKARAVVEKRFGLSRASTLLHFISGGRFPIFDSRVRRAMSRLVDSPVRNTIHWYLDSHFTFFSEVARECGTDDLRLSFNLSKPICLDLCRSDRFDWRKDFTGGSTGEAWNRQEPKVDCET